MSELHRDELSAVIDAAVDAGLALPHRRRLLLEHLPLELLARASTAATPRDTLRSDLQLLKMQAQTELLPLWLETASRLAGAHPAADTIRTAREHLLRRLPHLHRGLSVRVSGPPDPRSLAEVQQCHEVIVDQFWRCGRADEVHLELHVGVESAPPLRHSAPQILHLASHTESCGPDWLRRIGRWFPLDTAPLIAPVIVIMLRWDSGCVISGSAIAAAPFARHFYPALCAGASIAGAFEAGRAAVPDDKDPLTLQGEPASRAAILLPRHPAPHDAPASRQALAREAIQRLRGSARMGITTAEVLAMTRDV